jgi:hypothetical protein
MTVLLIISFLLISCNASSPFTPQVTETKAFTFTPVNTVTSNATPTLQSTATPTATLTPLPTQTLPPTSAPKPTIDPNLVLFKSEWVNFYYPKDWNEQPSPGAPTCFPGSMDCVIILSHSPSEKIEITLIRQAPGIPAATNIEDVDSKDWTQREIGAKITNAMVFQSIKTKSEQLQFVDGMLDPCLFLKPAEVEDILGIKVKTMPIAMKGATGCKYVTSDAQQQTILMISIFTDTTLQNASMNYTAVFWFEQSKKMNIEMNIGKMEDLAGLGDQAYYRETTLNYVEILKNKIYYDFNARPIEAGGSVPKDKLIALAKIAMQRAP